MNAGSSDSAKCPKERYNQPPMSQIFLFTGENIYELQQEKRRWMREFTQKHGSENLLSTDAKSLKYSELLDEVCVAPFIAEKRLVVVDGIPKFDKDQIENLETAIHPQVLLLFIEPKPDKRLAATKALIKTATVKTFTRIRGSALLEWIAARAAQEGASISQSDARFLVDMVGEDQVLLANEVRKLATYVDDRAINHHDIEHMVVLSTEQAVWQLMDLLAAQKKTEALQFVQKLIKRGENAHGLWNMFLWIVSQLSQVTAMVTEGNTSPQAIAKACKMHPNTARNLVSLAKSYDAKRHKELITLITETDRDLKTGGFRATAESPEELNAIIDTRVAAVV